MPDTTADAQRLESDMAPAIVSPGACDRFVREWLACWLRTYPEQAGRFLREEQDRFRNPIGHALRTAVGELAEELFGGFDRTRVTASLDTVIRLRAVQDAAPADAAGFVLLARGALHAAARAADQGFGPGSVDLVERRLGVLAQMAADLFEECRAEIRAIAVRAARRRVYVSERARALAAGSGAIPASRPRPIAGGRTP